MTSGSAIGTEPCSRHVTNRYAPSGWKCGSFLRYSPLAKTVQRMPGDSHEFYGKLKHAPPSRQSHLAVLSPFRRIAHPRAVSRPTRRKVRFGCHGPESGWKKHPVGRCRWPGDLPAFIPFHAWPLSLAARPYGPLAVPATPGDPIRFNNDMRSFILPRRMAPS